MLTSRFCVGGPRLVQSRRSQGRQAGLDVRERVLYYHLLRRTHGRGREQTLESIEGLAAVTGMSEFSARKYVLALAERGVVRIEERSKKGTCCVCSSLLRSRESSRLQAMMRPE